MSSTIEHRDERGQILVIFAFSLLVVFGIAALVFDGGLMLLEKRTQQNAADAAALAGARFLADCPSPCADAEAAARAVATENGYTQGVGNITVDVQIPPASGAFANQEGHIEVLIDNQTGSFFSGIWGIFSHDVGSRAVAANSTGQSNAFAMLSLDPSGCNAVIVEGQGVLESNGDIQVNSSCPGNAMRLAGTGEVLTAPDVGCNVVGGFSQGGGATFDCAMSAANPPYSDSVDPIPDPYALYAEPPNTVVPLPIVQVSGPAKDPQPACPGGPGPDATHATPAICQFNGSYSGRAYRLFPGYYPGGLLFESGTFYLEPGIYYVGGGGFQLRGGSSALYSVEPGTTSVGSPCDTSGAGVLIFNGNHPTAASGAIDLAGGGSQLQLCPLKAPGTELNNFAIFQDREVCLDARIVGNASSMFIRGIIYIPGGPTCPADQPVLIAEGDGGTVTTDQVIAFRFQIKGNGGGLTVAFDDKFTQGARVAGLVE